jgi:hypothetical protein
MTKDIDGRDYVPREKSDENSANNDAEKTFNLKWTYFPIS